jgi:two-component system OmpR family sensor kinase
MLLLALVGLTLTGIFGARLLRGYLIDRVDEQLGAAVDAVTPDRDLGGTPPQQQLVPSQFHITVLNADGTPYRSYASALTASAPELPAITPQAAARADARPFTVDATRGSGSWRAVALAFRDGSGSLVIATSLDDVDDTVARLVHIDLIVGLLVLTGLAVAGYSLVRTALAPLTEIELTAAAIGRGDLGRRVPDHDPGTEMGRLSRALNAMLEQIERAFRDRSASEARARRSEQRMRRFVADASHELRTPLTSIRGFAELHRQGAVTDPPAVSGLLARIEDEATRMGLLVDDLLLLARLDQERPLRATVIDLGRVLDDAAAAARATAPDREITVEREPAPGPGPGPGPDAGVDAPIVVPGDDARVRQVVTNLVDNALAYSPPGTPVTLRLSRTTRGPGAMAAIEVVDRGPGLTAEQAERVFERFYRTDAARSRAHGGTGLGLSIVAAITAAHGGAVELDTAPGEGATFRVLLPVAPEPSPPAPAPGTSPPPEAPPPPPPPPAPVGDKLPG